MAAAYYILPRVPSGPTAFSLAFNLIERRLDEGQDVQVRCSIQAYRKAFTETGCDDALNRLLKVLEQPN
jgi:hypothetical protein